MSWLPGQIINSRIGHGAEFRSLVLVCLFCSFVFCFFFLLDLLIYLLIHFFYHFQQNTEIVWCDSSKPVSATIVVLLHLAGFLKTVSPNGPVSSNCVSRPKIISKVAMMKTTSAAMLFPLLLLSLSSLFLFLLSFFSLRYCDFRASRAHETCLLTQMTANFVFKLNRLDIYNIICIYSCPTLVTFWVASR